MQMLNLANVEITNKTKTSLSVLIFFVLETTKTFLKQDQLKVFHAILKIVMKFTNILILKSAVHL